MQDVHWKTFLAIRKTNDHLFKVLRSEFIKFKSIGIDLNESHKESNKAVNITKKAEKYVEEGWYIEKELIRKELKNKLIEERKGKRKNRAAKKIQKFVKKNYAKEKEFDEVNNIYIGGVKVIQAYYIGFLQPASNKFINSYYKLPNQLNYKESANKYKSSQYFSWKGLESFKNSMEEVFIKEKNAFKCNVAMSYILYKEIKNQDGNIQGYILRLYHSSINNGALFNNPVEIHDRNTLNKFVKDAVEKI